MLGAVSAALHVTKDPSGGRNHAIATGFRVVVRTRANIRERGHG
jgi:hypothetical protein